MPDVVNGLGRGGHLGGCHQLSYCFISLQNIFTLLKSGMPLKVHCLICVVGLRGARAKNCNLGILNEYLLQKGQFPEIVVFGEAAKLWVGFVFSNLRRVWGFPHVIGKSSEVVRLVTKGLEMSCPQEDLLGKEQLLVFISNAIPEGLGMAAWATMLII